jgi:hypothetical protein
MVLLVAAGVAGAATYYVDSETGQDDPSRKGGPSDPWRTITYALSRVSGENTFMCRGVFVEEITVEEDDAGSAFEANAEAKLDGSIATNECHPPLLLAGFRIDGTAAAGTHSGLLVAQCSFTNPDGSALSLYG